MGSLVPTAKRRLANALKKGSARALPDWAYRLAEWRCEQTRKNIPVADQAIKASEFAGADITPHDVRKIQKSATFSKYLSWCSNDRLAAARHLVETQLLKAVRLRGDAMDWARGTHDVGNASKLTDRYLDIIHPKSGEAAPVQANIQINFTDAQRAVHEMPELIAETVAIEPEEIATGD